MKTLKELLFERHRDAEPGLELARQEFLARLRDAQSACKGGRASPRTQTAWQADRDQGSRGRSPSQRERCGRERLWHEYLLPLRWHLAGMSAVWLAVLLLHFDTSPAPAAPVAKAGSPDPRQVLAALREKRQELLDLTAPPAARLSLPLRRSEAAPVRSAGFQTCCVAGFQACGTCEAPADLEVGDTAGLETCATANRHPAIAIG